LTPLTTEHARRGEIDLSQLAGSINGEATDRCKIVQLELTVKRRLHLATGTAQFLLLKFKFYLMYL
jgi:hypothetical protein